MFQSRFLHRNTVFPNVNLSVQTLTSSEMLSLFAGVVMLSQVVARSGLSPQLARRCTSSRPLSHVRALRDSLKVRLFHMLHPIIVN